MNEDPRVPINPVGHRKRNIYLYLIILGVLKLVEVGEVGIGFFHLELWFLSCYKDEISPFSNPLFSTLGFFFFFKRKI